MERAARDSPSRIVVAGDRELYARLERLARAPRMVFFAGLPGTGKSLLIHQLAHLAGDAGRTVHLCQWDVARPVFEASEAGRRYPVVDGVTHAVVRKAVGLWARRALVEWERRWTAPEHLLIGEAPFVGSRLIELARQMADDAEAILAAPTCRFAIPVPSREVRRFLEAERARRAARPSHPREREDAPPHVLRDLWRELVGAADALGIPVKSRDEYDPLAYRRVYEGLLGRRHVEVIPVSTVLATATLSVHEFSMPHADLVPGEAEARTILREVEARYPDAAALARDVERWWTG
jgi:hypothetical protein